MDLYPSMISLVDPYANLGGADPVTIACALKAHDNESQYLDPRASVIVTDGKAVTAMAKRFGVVAIGTVNLTDQIDSSIDAQGSRPATA